MRQWRVWPDGADIVTEYGTVGGQLQTSRKTCVAKNAGKANATTPEQQAVAEAAALHKYKLDRKYSLTMAEAAKTLPLPMAAKDYHKKQKDGSYKLTSQGKQVEWPVDIQPKLDGGRILAKWEGNDVVFLSRSGKQIYDLPHIKKEVESWLPKDWIVDGECYIHGVPLQTLMSLMKKYKKGSENLNFCIFDVPVGEAELQVWDLRRHDLYRQGVVRPSDHVKIVPCFQVSSHDEAILRQGKFIGAGYEGAIIRVGEGVYEWGYRSGDLLKLKQFLDEEFKVVGINEGRGKMLGCAIFVCENNNGDGQTFEAVPKTTQEMKGLLWQARESLIGSKVTIRFQQRSNDGLPSGNPIAVAFRPPEDLG